MFEANTLPESSIRDTFTFSEPIPAALHALVLARKVSCAVGVWSAVASAHAHAGECPV